MIVPTDPGIPLDVRRAFQDIIDEIGSLQSRLAALQGGGGIGVREFDDLRKRVAGLEQTPTYLDFNDVMRGSGAAHALGYAPDPGETAWDERFLSEEGKWRFPLLGLIRVATRLGVLGEKQLAGDILSVLGSMTLIGNIGAAKAYLKDLEVTGRISNPGFGRMVFAAAFSSGQYFTTGGANLTNYDYTFDSTDINVGDIIEFGGTVALGGTTAGTKSLTLTVGAGAARTIFSSTVATINTVFQFWIRAIARSATNIAGTGWAQWAVAGSPMAGTNFFNYPWAVSDVTANAQLCRLIGTNTGANNECRMTDYFIWHCRAPENFKVV